jgi:hypothetical protein
MSKDIVVTERHIIKGTILRCVDGKWVDADGLQPPEPLVVMGVTQALQCWRDGKPTDTVVKRSGESLPNVDDLNEQIPKNEWEKGLNGEPRPPWVHQHIVYLVDPGSAEAFTFLNSTWGARIAVERLAERISNMRQLRGVSALPLVKLESRQMKTKFGTKQRPEFVIVEWRELANQPEVKAIEHKPKADDAKAAKPGRPVAPPTLSEELNDVIPTFG